MRGDGSIVEIHVWHTMQRWKVARFG